jgi:hypothetical protein
MIQQNTETYRIYLDLGMSRYDMKFDIGGPSLRQSVPPFSLCSFRAAHLRGISGT